MNRIQHLVDEDWERLQPARAPSREPESPVLSADAQCHCIFTPLHYERNYAYPLIVWLHGPDDTSAR